MTLPPPAVHDRVAFAAAVVRSLKDFQDAYATMVSIEGSKSAIDLFSSIDIANEDLQCASDAVGGFSGDSDEGTHATVTTLQRTAAVLTGANTKMKELAVARLNGDSSQEKPGDHAARMANIAGVFRNAWGMLPLTATLTVLAVEESVPPANKRMRLAMTEAQRDSLTHELSQAFPGLENRAGRNDLSQAEVAAAVLYEGLNQKGWSFRSEPSPSGANLRP
ncbi:MAG: hypothetical protein ABIU96_02425 [Rhodanobacter sp.]